MAADKRRGTRTHLTLQQKAKLWSFLVDHPELSQSDVADWVREHFHVRLGRTTLYRIQHAPEGAFAKGTLSHKKQRRVKFPLFEKRLLTAYEERWLQNDHVTDDVLLRHAAECRAACGISESELKLSNGWLYRFKIRHQLTAVPMQAGQLDDGKIQEDTTPLLPAVHVPAVLPELPVLHALSGDEGTGAMLLSARALTTLQAPGFFNWEPVSEVQRDKAVMVTDGILLPQQGVYQLSVDVKHSVSAIEAPVFKVSCNDRVVGHSVFTTMIQNDVASSICVDLNLFIHSHEVLRVEYLASGYAFADSTLVLRCESPNCH